MCNWVDNTPREPIETPQRVRVAEGEPPEWRPLFSYPLAPSLMRDIAGACFVAGLAMQYGEEMLLRAFTNCAERDGGDVVRSDKLLVELVRLDNEFRNEQFRRGRK